MRQLLSNLFAKKGASRHRHEIDEPNVFVLRISYLLRCGEQTHALRFFPRRIEIDISARPHLTRLHPFTCTNLIADVVDGAMTQITHAVTLPLSKTKSSAVAEAGCPPHVSFD